MSFSPRLLARRAALIAFAGLAACSSKHLDPLPSSVDQAKVPQQKVVMQAKKYAFDPERVVVKQGTLLTLEVTAQDVTHGISISDFGIDELLEPHITKTIRIYAADKGTHSFRCSHLCGIGHLSMTGEIVVE